MITIKELLKGVKLESLPKEHQDNLIITADKMTLLQLMCIDAGLALKVWIVTSGYRSKEDHLRIYKEKAAKEGKKFDASQVKWGSQHLKGAACDISDPKLEITKFLKARPDIVKDVDLYFEDGNSNWLHGQLYSPKSGKRWFFPG